MTLERFRESLCNQRPLTAGFEAVSPEIDYELWEFISADLRRGETSLLTRSEVVSYLKTHEADGLKALRQLVDLTSPDTCQPRVPLFAADARSAVLQVAERFRSGRAVNYDDVLEERPLDRLPHGDPDPRLVESLLQTMRWKPGDPKMFSARIGLPVNLVSVTLGWEAGDFVPPAHLFPANVDEVTRQIWSAAEVRLFQEAWIRLIRPRLTSELYEKMDSLYLNGLAEKYPEWRVSLVAGLYGMDIHFRGASDGTANLRRARDRFVAELRGDLKRSLESVLKDVDLVRKIFSAAADEYLPKEKGSYELKPGEEPPIIEPLAPGVDPLQQVARHLGNIRDLAETKEGEDVGQARKAFLDTLGNAVKAYARRDKDFGDLDVTLLSAQDAAFGYQGIYLPRTEEKRRAQVQIAMSVAGSVTLRTREDVLGSLVRGMVEHKMRKKKGNAKELAATITEFFRKGTLSWPSKD